MIDGGGAAGGEVKDSADEQVWWGLWWEYELKLDCYCGD